MDCKPSGLKYEYDEENRLSRVRIAANDAPLLEIEYDAVGRRVETVDYWDAQNGSLDPPRHTRHVYDGLQTVEDYMCEAATCGWSLAREFFWGGRFPEPITMVDHTAAGLLPANQPEILHYLHDVLGSVIGLTNSAGTLVERYTYDPYGKTLVERRDPLTGSFELNGADGNFPTWSAFGNPLMWTAQRYDATVGLYHFKYRTYNPVWGRWHQQDPLGYVDGLNLYEYVSANPLYWIDPLGDTKGFWNTIWEPIGGAGVIGPYDAYSAAYGKDATFARSFGREMADKYGTSAKHRERVENAARHAAWQARLTHRHGEKKAKKIADLHEAGEEGTADSETDQHNNQVGRDIGKNTKDDDEIKKEVEKALKEGKLVTDNDDPRIKDRLNKKGDGDKDSSGSDASDSGSSSSTDSSSSGHKSDSDCKH
ncbi:MAG: RHS repeat-associated core domain-containing protein [Phycisphaerae bacterium]|nr:RHS repeat-associated core domain-containing protein [Phycisphaerae bacterium]